MDNSRNEMKVETFRSAEWALGDGVSNATFQHEQLPLLGEFVNLQHDLCTTFAQE